MEQTETFLSRCLRECMRDTCPMKEELPWIEAHEEQSVELIERFRHSVAAFLAQTCEENLLIGLQCMADKDIASSLLNTVRDASLYGYIQGRKDQLAIDKLESMAGEKD